MTVGCSCADAHSMAGAIALEEADDALRDRYRLHLSTCQRCAADIGGERELERVMATLKAAREAERWEPEMRQILSRQRGANPAWKWAGALCVAVAIVVGARGLGTHAGTTLTVAPVAQGADETQRAIASLGTQTSPSRVHATESLVFGSTTPPTVRLEIRLDARGTARSCAVIKSSGRESLDRAFCRSAMGATASAR